MNKQINCSSIIELLESRIANGQFEITESDLMKELQEMPIINESTPKSIDEDTTLLESIYANMDKVLGE